MNSLKLRLSAVGIAIASIGLASLAPLHAPGVEANVICVGDECDAGAWQLARGEVTLASYWGMSAGHNCTNYVAWRLSQDGVERPQTGPGDAADWAANAVLDDILVDDQPAIGAVAQWDSLAGGYGVDGHVAYIEEVLPDGSFVASEDFWRGGDQSGQLTYQTFPAGSASHIIHYGLDRSAWLRTSTDQSDGWHTRSTNVDPPDGPFAVTAASGELRSYFVVAGELHEAIGSSSGGVWTDSATGIASTSTSLSAVDMGRGSPYLLSVDAGTLWLYVHNEDGWQTMPTGLTNITGTISAVNGGTMLPLVALAQAGSLYIAWGDADGWHITTTGLQAWGDVVAVNVGGSLEIYGIANSQLVRSWWDTAGWHQEATGALADRVAGARAVDGTAEITFVRSGEVLRFQDGTTDPAGDPLGITAAVLDRVIDLDGVAVVVQAGAPVDLESTIR